MYSKKKIIITLGCLLVVTLLYAFVSQNNEEKVTTDVKHIIKMKGLCWVAGDSIGEYNFNRAKEVGSNWISQTPFGWMNGHDNPEVVLSNDRAWWGETDRGIRHTAELARTKGIKSMLKPHIWLRRANDKWRSDIEMDGEKEWKQWFESYRQWIMHYAKLAEAAKIESLCIGTELYQTTKQHPDEWRKIIKDIRSVYHGELTYAANWYKEYEEITFWDDLDYIGIQAYFPISDRDHPEKKEMKKSWDKHLKSMKKIADRYHKKIVFTEIGYKNTSDAGTEPWTWPQDMGEHITISEETQIACYEALFESIATHDFIDGLFIWKWFHSTYKQADEKAFFEEWDQRRKERAAKNNGKARLPIYFTPQRGRAVEVLQKYFK